MPKLPPPREGDVYTHQRTFSNEDVREFGEISGDQQEIHTVPDEEGRLIVQGLLTATIPTKIGGDASFIARSMNFRFHQPVYTGETITGSVTIETVEERADRYNATISVVCTNENDETVMTAECDGLVWK